jgi:hypothetical protein
MAIAAAVINNNNNNYQMMFYKKASRLSGTFSFKRVKAKINNPDSPFFSPGLTKPARLSHSGGDSS